MPTISEAESQQRRQAVSSVIGTHEMEGITLAPDARQLLDRYAAGEMTLEEFSAGMDGCAEALLAKRGLLVRAA
jgi:hypothetical protein